MLITDIHKIEQLQRRATKFILGCKLSDYRSRLLALELLPLMMHYELADIMFFITNIKLPSESFNILEYVAFSTTNTRSSTTKLIHTLARPVLGVSLALALSPIH